MAWETRGNRSYFYRKERINGKVKSEYVGSDEVAALLDRCEKGRRELKELEKENQKRERMKAEFIDDETDALSEINQSMVDALFFDKRLSSTQKAMEKKAKMNKSVEIKNAQDMVVLVKRIDKGDPKPEALKALAIELNAKPEIYRSVGNLQSNIFDEILRDFVSSAFAKECAERQIEEMKIELGYQSSTFVEKMLIDEIIMRWLRLQNMEIYHKNATSQSHSLEQGMYVDKRLDMAQKRFLRSINTLAKVRKMIAQTQAKGAEMLKNLTTKN